MSKMSAVDAAALERAPLATVQEAAERVADTVARM
jgi:hypothetical protein